MWERSRTPPNEGNESLKTGFTHTRARAHTHVHTRAHTLKNPILVYLTSTYDKKGPKLIDSKLSTL